MPGRDAPAVAPRPVAAMPTVAIAVPGFPLPGGPDPVDHWLIEGEKALGPGSTLLPGDRMPAGRAARRPGAGRPGAGRPVAGRPDAGGPDAGSPDAGGTDAGGPDGSGRDDGGICWRQPTSQRSVTASVPRRPSPKLPARPHRVVRRRRRPESKAWATALRVRAANAHAKDHQQGGAVTRHRDALAHGPHRGWPRRRDRVDARHRPGSTDRESCSSSGTASLDASSNGSPTSSREPSGRRAGGWRHEPDRAGNALTPNLPRAEIVGLVER